MDRKNYASWSAKNERLNANREIAKGDRIYDAWMEVKGTVTHIQKPRAPSVENHGSITVVDDNYEEHHYVWFGWWKFFRVTEKEEA